jgi:hypothetical protein
MKKTPTKAQKRATLLPYIIINLLIGHLFCYDIAVIPLKHNVLFYFFKDMHLLGIFAPFFAQKGAIEIFIDEYFC